MSDYYPSPHQQTAPPSGSGCLLQFFLPPLSVMIVGTLLAVILSQVQISTAATAPPSSPTQSAVQQEISPIFTPEVQRWESKILRWSERYRLDPNLIATVMQIESCGNPAAVSPAGAMGLFQVMPYHFSDGDDPYAPGDNARRGLRYLRDSQEKGGSIRLALAGYNGGIQGATRPEDQWPDETRRYVYWGVGIYQDARAGKENSPRLQEWLSSGGKALCQQAR